MQIIRTSREMRMWSSQAHDTGLKLSLVPTMGFLHEGHLSLVREARNHTDKVIVSIFVNPTQFAPNEDLDQYPRDLEGDFNKLRQLQVDAVFCPSPQEVYPDNYDTFITPDKLALHLCGKSRPIHFRGVCTVVYRLFQITKCDTAIFGKKDYQQLQIIKQMVKDLCLDIQIVGGEIVRESDGVAMSSRNKFLDKGEREQAVALIQSLGLAEIAAEQGETSAEKLIEIVKNRIGMEPDATIDYVSIVDASTLEPNKNLKTPILIALAVKIGKTRLIDNKTLYLP